MLSYQKNTLLALLAQFKSKLWEDYLTIQLANNKEQEEQLKKAVNIIDRNITSIEKQLKRL